MTLDARGSVEIDVKGAERAAAAARSALQPWGDQAQRVMGAFKSLGGAVGQISGQMLQDLGRVATVGSSFSMAGAIQGVRGFEASVSDMAVATGRDFESIKNQINALSTTLGQKPEQIAGFISNVGRATYDFSGPQKNLEAFSKFAKETGREVGSTSGLAQAFKRLGADDADKQLQQLRATAQSLGTVGGVAALADQVTALSGALSRASNGAGQLGNILGQLGKGTRGPAEAAEVQSAVVQRFMGNQRQYEQHFKWSGALKKGESLFDKNGRFDVQKAMRLRQAELRKIDKTGMIAAGEFGNMVASRQFMNADLSGNGPAEGFDTDALKQYKATPGGKRQGWDALKDVRLQDWFGAGTALGGLADKFQEFSAENPMTGKAAELGTEGVLGYLGGKMLWKGGKAVAKGATKAAPGLGLRALGMLGGAGAGGVAAALGTAVGTGTVLADIGQDRDTMGAEWRAGQGSTIEAEQRQLALSAGKAGATPIDQIMNTYGKAQSLGMTDAEAAGLAAQIAKRITVKVEIADATANGIDYTIQPGATQ